MRCSVPGCVNDNSKPSCSELSWHSYPKNPKVLDAWLARIRRLGFQPGKNDRVCSTHFTPDCFELDMRSDLLLSRDLTGVKKPKRRLRPDAVPSLRLGGKEEAPKRDSSYVQRKEHERVSFLLLFFLLFCFHCWSLPTRKES